MKLKDLSSEVLRKLKSAKSSKGIGTKLCVGAAMILAAGAISISAITGNIEATDSLVQNESEQTQENSASIDVYEAQAPEQTTQVQTEKLTAATTSTTASSTEKTTTTVTAAEETTQAAVTTTTSKTTTTTAEKTTTKKTTTFKTYTMYTNTELNLRSGAGTSYESVTVIPSGKSVTVTGEADGNWLPVKYGSKSGYVHSDYLQETKPTTTTTVITTTTTTTTKATTTQEVTYLGTFKVTGYCSCEKCCGSSSGYTSSGTKATEGRTIAASSDYAFGTQLMFNGTVYTVEDRGGSVSDNVIDLYFDTHEEAVSWGVRYCEVYLVG